MLIFRKTNYNAYKRTEKPLEMYNDALYERSKLIMCFTAAQNEHSQLATTDGFGDFWGKCLTRILATLRVYIYE